MHACMVNLLSSWCQKGKPTEIKCEKLLGQNCMTFTKCNHDKMTADKNIRF